MPEIREARLADVEDAHEMWITAWEVLYKGDEARSHIGGVPEPASVMADQMRAGAVCFVAEEEGRIIGVARCRQEEGETYHLYRMAVLPEFRRKGVGAALIRAVEQAASASGGRIISLRCIAEMGLPDYYTKKGFKEVRRSPNVNSGGSMTDVRMEKRIIPEV